MTTGKTMKWLLVALLAAACNGSSSKGGPVTTETADVPPPPTSWDVVPPQTAPEAGVVCLLMRGVLNPGYTALYLSVADVKVWVDGEAADVSLDGASMPMNLADADRGWLMGRFAVPAPGKVVKVRLVLDDRGSFEGMGAGDIDARGLPIEFTVPSDWFQPWGRALIDVDLARSVVGDGATRVLLPQMQLFF